MHKLFLIILLLIFCPSSIAQIKMSNTNSAPISRLTLRQSKKLIIDHQGLLDTSFQKEYLNDAYILNNGKAVLLFDTHGFLYSSIDAIRDWISSLKEKQRQHGTSHILEGKLLYGSEFPAHTAELIDNIVRVFKLEDKTPSIEQLRIIDECFNQENNKIVVDENIYSGLVAYVGEIMRKKILNSKWDMVYVGDNVKIWEPYIRLNEKRYNPFLLVYKELFEELPEVNQVNLYDHLIIELDGSGG